jgi:hypothetical protein
MMLFRATSTIISEQCIGDYMVDRLRLFVFVNNY